MENGISAPPSVEPAIIPAAGVETPTAFPSVVEPVSGSIVEHKKRTGPVRVAETMRMEVLMQFISGELPTEKYKKLAFLKAANLTINEKAYLVKHPYFKDIYDARLFDMFMGLEELTKEDTKLMGLVASRVGFTKGAQINVGKMNMLHQDGPVSIRVKK